jgi:hypothetical protein
MAVASPGYSLREMKTYGFLKLEISNEGGTQLGRADGPTFR